MSARRRSGRTSRAVKINILGPIMAHVGFEGARHMHPERIPTQKQEKTVSLRLFELTKETEENVQQYSGTIKRLMIEGLQLKSVSDSLIDQLVVLEKLDLGNNQLGDGSLPDSFKRLQNLVELNLNHNKFTKVPTAIRKLKNLSRLNLSHNDIESLRGLDKLRKMQVLMLDHNKFTHVFKDVSHMRKLEILDCSSNCIREVGLDIKQLKALKELNISENRISVVPTDVFLLPKLECLNASQNQISKVPSFNMQPQNTHTISEIDLAGNAINKFPGHLLLVSKKLDLAENRIKVLDWNKMKKIDWTNGSSLCVEGNPLTSPPRDIAEAGIKSMVLFFQESQVNMKVYQGVKVLVLGAADSGKTSFVQSLVDGQARLSQEMYEKSAGIEAYDMSLNIEVPPPKDPDQLAGPPSAAPSAKTHRKGSSVRSMSISSLTGRDGSHSSTAHQPAAPTEKSLNLSVWDFCGDPFYLFPHYVFFEQPAIAILTFNMQQYKSEKFDEMIGSWFDWMVAKTNKLVVLLVGTHVDKLKKIQIEKVNTEVKSKLSAHLDKQRQVVEAKIKVITEKAHISPTLSDQLKTYMTLLQDKLTVQSDVILTSASTFTGYDVVKASLTKLVKDDKLFPNVLRTIPTFWLDVENYVEEKGNAMIVPVMKMEDFKEDVTAKFGMKHLLPTILQYLHETGKVMWFSSHSTMKEFVFLRPSWLLDISKAVFRHDFKDKLSIEVEEAYRTVGMNQSKYDLATEDFLNDGVVDRELLKCMLSHLVPLEMNSAFTQVLKLLTDSFNLGYMVSKRSRESDYNLDPDLESPYTKKILIPWFRKTELPESVEELWNPLEKRRKLVAVCRFPRFLPPGLFEVLSVRMHKESHNLKYLAHWGNGIHARHKEQKVQMTVVYSSQPDETGTSLRFEIREDCDQNMDEVPAANMWSVLSPALNDFEELVQNFTGVLVERLMECPCCMKLSFQGEWKTPKETQGLATRHCEDCSEPVDTAFLVPPREKKRDDVLLVLAKRRRDRRQALINTDNEANISEMVHAPIRQGRRLAVMPTDVLLMSHRSMEDERSSDESDSGEEAMPVTFNFRGRANLNPADLPVFNPTHEDMDNNGLADENDDENDDENNTNDEEN